MIAYLMTSGNRVRDLRVDAPLVSQDCTGQQFFGTGKVGQYYKKVWSGADSSDTVIEPAPPVFFKYTVPRPDGTSYVKRVRVRSKPKPKVLRENPYSCEIIMTSDEVMTAFVPCSQGSAVAMRKGSVTTEFVAFGSPTPSQMWSDNDRIALVGRLSDKISDQQFNAAVFLGEGKESLQTIAQAAQRLRKAMKALRRGNPAKAAGELLGKPKRGKRVSKEHITQEWLASNWLQLQYGWKPLVQDISSAAAHFAHMQNRPQTLTYRVGKTKDEIPVISPSSSWRLSGYVGGRISIKALVTRIDELALLGLKDPASVLWEKTPWSFVADWIIPVGAYLEAKNLQRSLTATYVTTEYYRYQQSGGNFDSGPFLYFAGAGQSRERIVVERTVSTNLNVPLPGVKPLEKITTFKHAVNAIALLVQQFSGGRKTPL